MAENPERGILTYNDSESTARVLRRDRPARGDTQTSPGKELSQLQWHGGSGKE